MTKYERMKEKTLSSREVFKGKVLNVYVDNIELSDGRKTIREVIRHCSAAAVLAINEKGEVLLEDQFRYPYDAVLTEIPAGKGDPGEDSRTTAIRELEEETGYRAGNIELLGEFYPSVGYTDEVIGIYLATDLKKTEQHLDEGEFLDYYFISLEEFKRRVRGGEIKDGKTVAALAYYLLKKEEK